MSAALDALQQRLGYRFAQPWLLQQALTHRSFAAEHNERLEFLGDTVLNLAITQHLFETYPAVSEGDLSRARANLVRQETLHGIALQIGVAQSMRLGDGEIKSGGFTRASMLADVVEAMLGAVLLDAGGTAPLRGQGYAAAYAVVQALYAPLLADFEPGARQKDPKSALQEMLQGAKLPLPEYSLTQTAGAAHVQVFEVLCRVQAWGVQAYGEGASRKIAEQEAAKAVLLLKPAKPISKTKKNKTTLASPQKAAPKQMKLKAATQQTPHE